MELIGSIPYITTEGGAEREWEAVFVYRARDSFRFKNNRHLPYSISFEVPDLAFCLQVAERQLYPAYSPLFKQPDFQELAAKIFCSRTFFERSDAFQQRNGYGSYVGFFYDEDQSYKKAGSHVKVNKAMTEPWPISQAKSTEKEISLVLFHEYAHEMHYQSCLAGISRFGYGEYDSCITEVLATHAERRIEKVQQSEKYNAYVNLIMRLERLPDFAATPFHQQWEKMLSFTNQRELVRYLQQRGV